MKEQLLWTSWNLDYEKCRDHLEAKFPYMDEDARIDLMFVRNREWLEQYLKAELDVPLERQIIAFTESKYKGRKEKSYDILSNKLSSIFIPFGKIADFYLDEYGNARLIAKYPDHTDKVVFRVLRKRTSTKTLKNTLMKWMRGYILAEDFTDPIGTNIEKCLYGGSIGK